MRKLKVLYISNNGGGAPLSLLNMIHSLQEWVEPVVLFPQRSDKRFCLEDIQCVALPFLQEIYTKGTWERLSFFDKIGYVRNQLKCYWLWNRNLPKRLTDSLKTIEFDLVHTNTGAIDVGVYVARELGAKHIWHLREFQDIDYNSRPQRGWWLFNRHLRQSDGVVAITHAIYDHFNLIKHPNSHVIWNAVKSINDASWVEQKEKYILFAANVLVEGKGLHDLLAAYRQSVLPTHGIKLKIAGNEIPGEYYNKLRNMIERFGIRENVECLGHVDVKPYMERAMAFCMPSINEALGRVAVEAMFYGCPVIVRNAGGPKEYVQHGKNGYLFNSVDELTGLLNNVISTDQLSVILAAQQFAKDNFSEEVYGEKMMAVYETTLKRSSYN